jgi:outer membrane receptor protein involved in Fe transport
VRAAVALALGTAAMMASAPRVFAADDAGPASAAAPSAPVLEEVTVTGSRIKRKDLESSSPLVTIDSEQIEQRAGLNLESYLNTLPNYNPAQAPTTENEDVQPSAVNTVGISTISLRGLGPNRNLTLIDGHRTTPINALMVTDINTIPAAMIERVEIITGGASTVYGADAISGVTNFIMKKDFQGLQIDAQDSITQAGDGNELTANVLMGSKISDGKGNLIMGVEYYNRREAFQRNREFFTNSWADPASTLGNAFFVQGYNGYSPGLDTPSPAALQTLFPQRTVNPANGAGVCAFTGCVLTTFYFNPGGGVFTNNGSITTGNFTGNTSNPIQTGYGLVNALDNTMQNSATAAAGPPGVVQNLRWNNPYATISEPQTRYSFFANGTYDITDKIQAYTNARFAQSQTTTLLDTPTTSIFGWEASVPFNAATDSPIDPAQMGPTSTVAQLQAIAAAFKAGTPGTYANPGYIGPNAPGAGHPVPWQLAMMLMSRTIFGLPVGTLPGTFFGGAASCNNSIAANLCSKAPTSWILDYLPFSSAPQRSTVDTSQVWQIETGIKFPLFADWTGDLYYSRGQSDAYEVGIGNDSLQRWRAVIDSPNYGGGQTFQGNANGASTNFGTSVPTKCTSGFYGTIFGGDASPASQDCYTAIAAPLQTQTQMQQDIVEANFQGTLFKLPAGDVSAAVGYQYRRDSGQFSPDNLQSTYSFLDQTIGLYPLGTLNNELSSKDGYLELYIPVLSGLPFLQKLDLDVGGRYSTVSNNIPSSTTFKINLDAQLTKQFRIRGGFNRATRSPNLGELYLGEQEYFGFGAQYGDPCSLRSPAPYGAGGAAPDIGVSGSSGKLPGTPTNLAPGQTAAGAQSTYLICQSLMGATGVTQYYGPTGNQGAGAAAAVFAWLNEQGNPNLKSETANTWTGGIVFSNLGDSPWISGLSGSLDWWQIDVAHAIELDTPDYANFLCYGTNIVSTAAAAAAQAQTPACQSVIRNQATGGQIATLLTYTNQATIGIAGVDFQLNWFAQLADLGLKVPGGLLFNTQDTFLQYYKTKQSPASFDVDINWKDSLGPNLPGTNPGAYGYRLNATLGYVLPSFTMNLRWRFLPSANTANHAAQQGIIANNKAVAAGGSGILLGYIPNRDIAAPSWNAFDLSFSWNINKILQLRGGVNNLLDKQPAITGKTAGFPPGTVLNQVCAGAPGCQNPTAYSLPNDGTGLTNAGYYDVYGRTFFVGLKARF